MRNKQRVKALGFAMALILTAMDGSRALAANETFASESSAAEVTCVEDGQGLLLDEESPEVLGYTAHTRDEAVAWAISQNGKALDYDGAYGAQCVDLIAYYYRYLGASPVGGNANAYVSNKLPAGWTRVTSGFQPGDVLATTQGTYGHVGILTEVTSNKYIVYDINGSVTGKVAKTSYSKTSGYWQCAIRPDFPSNVTGVRLETGAGRQIPDGDYRIVCGISETHSQKLDQWAALDIAGTATTCSAGANVQLSKNMTHASDVFTVTYLNNGFYRITQKGTNMALEVQNASMADLSNVQMGQLNTSSEAQMWDIEVAPDIEDRGTAWYAIRARNNSFVMDAYGVTTMPDNSDVNTILHTWNGSNNQKWKFIPVTSDNLEDGEYHIVSAMNESWGLGVAWGSKTDENYKNAVLTSKILSDATTFTVKKDGDYYSIRQKSTRDFLDAEGAGTKKNAGFWAGIGKNNNTPNPACQMWSLKSDGAGAFYIASRFNGAYFDIENATLKEGQNIWLHWYNGADCQKWKFLKAVTGIEFSQTSLEIELNETSTLTLSVTPEDAAYRQVKWTSDNEDIATVDSNGKIKGISEGQTVITAESRDGGYTAVCTVTVKEKQSEDVKTVFDDISSSAWYVKAVQFAYDNGIMNGKGQGKKDASKQRFEPNANITRAEFATVLYNRENQPEAAFIAVFTDVRNEKWYTKPVLWAYNSKIAKGYDNGKFGISDPITREQMAQMLYAYAKLKEYNTMLDPDALERFGDKNKVSSWAQNAMKWAVSNGVLKGSADEVPMLNPKGNATRAECAQMFKNMIENLAK